MIKLRRSPNKLRKCLKCLHLGSSKDNIPQLLAPLSILGKNNTKNMTNLLQESKRNRHKLLKKLNKSSKNKIKNKQPPSLLLLRLTVPGH